VNTVCSGAADVLSEFDSREDIDNVELQNFIWRLLIVKLNENSNEPFD